NKTSSKSKKAAATPALGPRTQPGMPPPGHFSSANGFGGPVAAGGGVASPFAQQAAAMPVMPAGTGR
ncbi:unnamed protein product, partial [Ectocarpus sp. 4 AP-2014]